MIFLFFLVFLLSFTLEAFPALDPGMPSTVVSGATPETLYETDLFLEGPSWYPSRNCLYFAASARAKHQVLRWDPSGEVTSALEESGRVNGTFLGNDGRLLCALVLSHQVNAYLFPATGPPSVQCLAKDPSWNQPNDICQSVSGHIYFTDPDWKERRSSAVYFLSRSGERPKRVIIDMPLPNGLIASNDGRNLYVSDSYLKLWKVYPIQPDGTTGMGRIFFNPDTEDQSDPDGMTIDQDGNLYLAGRGGIWVVSPKGNCLGLIKLPLFCTNVTFGGEEGTTLFMTCKGALLRLPMRVRGGQLAKYPQPSGEAITEASP